MATVKKKEKVIYSLPEAHVINQSLFERDVFIDPLTQKEGKPAYKIEVAFDPNDLLKEGGFADDCANFSADTWGDPWFDKFFKGEVVGPWREGDKLAARREEKGKEGSAYKGKLVLRADTQYNLHGQDGPGGVQVWDEDVKPITVVNSAALIYPGMYGRVGVTLHAYIDNRGDKCLKCYLEAFQRTRDGEKLVSSKDTSTLFKPVGRAAGAAAPVERRRRQD